MFVGEERNNFILSPESYSDSKLIWPHRSKCGQSAFTSKYSLPSLAQINYSGYLTHKIGYLIHKISKEWSLLGFGVPWESHSWFCLPVWYWTFVWEQWLWRVSRLSERGGGEFHLAAVGWMELWDLWWWCRVCCGMWGDNSWFPKLVIWRLKDGGSVPKERERIWVKPFKSMTEFV